MGKTPDKPEGLAKEIAKVLGSENADPKARIEAMHRLLKQKSPVPPPSAAGVYNIKGVKQQAQQNAASAPQSGPPPLAQDISIVTDFKDLLTCYRIRRAVFTEEQGIPQELDLDNDDMLSVHFLIYVSRQPVGVARLTPGKNAEAKLGRLAVLKPHRRRGLGTKLMKFILDFATQQKITEVIISAQQTTVSFYQKLGFSPVGAPYREANLPHQKMTMKLAK